MNRNRATETFNQDILIKHKQRIAFHEAGHAAGIHLNNKARQLPPVFFKIIIEEMSDVTADNCIARIEGGRLIELLPPSIDCLVRELAEYDDIVMLKDYMTAFEADIINLLIGPLAEAKHVADTDDELFNHKLVNLNALKNYGGNSDIALADEYLQSVYTDKQQRDDKLEELFAVAFDFINNAENWAAIGKLVAYILGSNENIIHYEEIVLTLDQSVDHFQNHSMQTRYYL